MPNMRHLTLLALACVLVAAPGASAASSRAMVLGVTPVELDADPMARDMESSKQLGLTLTRFSNFSWSAGKTTPAQVPGVASRFVRFHQAATPRGMRILLQTISYSEVPDTPQERSDYCTFTTNSALWARSLGANIAGVQVWNEPNLDTTPFAPAQYELLMEICYPMLKKAGFTVVSAGTAAPKHPAEWISQLGAVYRYRVKVAGVRTPLFDVLAHHPYMFGNGDRPWLKTSMRPQPEAAANGWLTVADYDVLVDVVNRAFAGSPQSTKVPIWYDEFGVRSNPLASPEVAGFYRSALGGMPLASVPDAVNRWNASPPARLNPMEPTLPAPGASARVVDQGTQYADTIRYVACTQPRVAAMFNFASSDPMNAANPAVFGFHMGFLWGNGARKPSWDLFEQVNREVLDRAVDCKRMKLRASVKPGRSSVRFRSMPSLSADGSKLTVRIETNKGKRSVRARLLSATGNRVLGKAQGKTNGSRTLDLTLGLAGIKARWVRVELRDGSSAGVTEWLVRTSK